MDDALLVRGLERLGDLAGNGQRVLEWNRTARDPRRQVFPIDELHHQRPNLFAARARPLLDAVDLRDVRVIERRERLCLALEPRQPFRVAREDVRQHFERDIAIQAGVARAKDLAHATSADGVEHLVRAEPGASCDRHRLMKEA